MPQPKFRVQHLVLCQLAQVRYAAPNNPYTLHEVAYFQELPGNAEFPVFVPEWWLYVRFFGGKGRRYFAVDVVWLDAPRGEQETCSYSFGQDPQKWERFS